MGRIICFWKRVLGLPFFFRKLYTCTQGKRHKTTHTLLMQRFLFYARSNISRSRPKTNQTTRKSSINFSQAIFLSTPKSSHFRQSLYTTNSERLLETCFGFVCSFEHFTPFSVCLHVSRTISLKRRSFFINFILNTKKGNDTVSNGVWFKKLHFWLWTKTMIRLSSKFSKYNNKKKIVTRL